MAEDDRLGVARTPVLVKDAHAVLGGHVVHRIVSWCGGPVPGGSAAGVAGGGETREDGTRRQHGAAGDVVVVSDHPVGSPVIVFRSTLGGIAPHPGPGDRHGTPWQDRRYPRV